MCNLYSMTTAQAAIIALTRALSDRTGNLAPLPEIYPDQLAPIVRNTPEGRQLAMARWGMPTPPQHLRTARDPGVTNIRNTASPHWRRWLGPAHRCLVPVTAFSEPGPDRKPLWFAPAAPETPMFFAGIEQPGWRSIRKVRDGETVDDLFAFLTTAPNAEVEAVHPKAMPVILTAPEDWDIWMNAPWEEARHLQRPLPDDSLTLIEPEARDEEIPVPAQGSLF